MLAICLCQTKQILHTVETKRSTIKKKTWPSEDNFSWENLLKRKILSTHLLIIQLLRTLYSNPSKSKSLWLLMIGTKTNQLLPHLWCPIFPVSSLKTKNGSTTRETWRKWWKCNLILNARMTSTLSSTLVAYSNLIYKKTERRTQGLVVSVLLSILEMFADDAELQSMSEDDILKLIK